MTDEAGNTHPDPDDAVRRLLADARPTEPMPADVAARMDDVLAGLADGSVAGAETSGPGADPAPIRPAVASLAAERRRRAAGMLVAAAAIVVGGVVVAQHLPSPGGAQSGASAAEDRGSSTAGGFADSSKSRKPEALSGNAYDRGRATVRNGRVVVRPQHFTSDAFAARRLLGQMRTASQSPGLVTVRPVLRRRAGPREARERDVRASPGGAGVPPPGEQYPGGRPVRLRVPPTGAVGHPPPPLTPAGRPPVGGNHARLRSVLASGRGALPVARPNRRPALRSSPCRSPL